MMTKLLKSELLLSYEEDNIDLFCIKGKDSTEIVMLVDGLPLPYNLFLHFFFDAIQVDGFSYLSDNYQKNITYPSLLKFWEQFDLPEIKQPAFGAAKSFCDRALLQSLSTCMFALINTSMENAWQNLINDKFALENFGEHTIIDVLDFLEEKTNHPTVLENDTFVSFETIVRGVTNAIPHSHDIVDIIAQISEAKYVYLTDLIDTSY